MPRPLRLEFHDAWYHVMNRGAGYKDIYKTTNHRQIFLELLAEVSSLFGIEIHSYCLMNNHYHLLIKTPRANLSRAMRHINGLYTQRFNRLEKHDGPLFRGRYKAIVVDCDEYLLQVSRYIHLNPVSAKLIKQPDQYKWSSYGSYIGINKKPSWLKTSQILSMISNKNRPSAYKKFIGIGIDDETLKFYEKNVTPTVFGKKNFKKALLKSLSTKQITASITDYRRTRALPSIKQINKVCADYFSVSEKALYQGCRGKSNVPRKIAIYGCRLWAAEKLSIIAEHYRCSSHGNISNVVGQVKQKIKTNKKVAEDGDCHRKCVNSHNLVS